MTQMSSVTSGSARDSLFVVAMPWLFVLTWSTDFIVAKYGMPYAEPVTFLFLRFVDVLVCLLPLVWLMRVPVPRRAGMSSTDWAVVSHIAVAGLLMQRGYLADVWATVKLGVPAGTTVLIVGMQPILAVLYVSVHGERVSDRQQLELLCGIAGVGLVVANKLHPTGASMTTFALCVDALLSITIDTLYQKRHCPVFDLRMGAHIQLGASALLRLPFIFLPETREVYWTLSMIGSLVWFVLALLIGAVSLLFALIHRGVIAKATSFLYLMPPTTAVVAWMLFSECSPPLAVLDMVITVCSMALVIRK